MRLAATLAVFTALMQGPLIAASKAPFTFEEMMKLGRIGEPQLSPDGLTVAFTVRTVEMASNATPAQIYTVALNGGAARQITRDGSQNARPRWMPDSKRIIFISNRSGRSQIWSMEADGSDARQLTNLPTEADGEIVSPDGKLLLFTSLVYPECASAGAKPGSGYDAGCNKTKLDQEAAGKMHARVYTHLLYRHWTTYQGARRSHLLIQPLDYGTPRGTPKDLTPGDRDVPPFSLGGPETYSFSPESTEIAYVSNTDPDLASSTNTDIFTVPAAGGEPTRLTTNPAADESPKYSPDGKYIAYRMQIRSGYESDLWRLAVRERATGQLRVLTERLDRWVNDFTWSPDSAVLFFTIEDHGHQPLLMVPADGNGAVRTIAQGPTTIDDVQLTRDGRTIIYTEQSGSKPVEIQKRVSGSTSSVRLDGINEAILNACQLTPLETTSVDSEDGKKVESFIVKPPGFDPARKYPVLFLIHGGPQGAWGESWSYRWNPQVFAAAGYVVVMPNPHGSVGYGQAFTDAVNWDWGGVPYDDIIRTVDSVSGLPYIDKNRMAAAGASYGGYMIDWILGHTDRFKALVVHAGVYDLRSMAGTTEELWFPKWEFQGMPWDSPDLYERWSPSNPKYVKNFKTPTLVTQGEMDYRVPVGQGQQLFTALQERKVPSKLILFPDEGHWIQKPQNSQFWYSQVLEWLREYVPPDAGSVPSAGRDLPTPSHQ
jgi:dipeptidyl aminopeptidase/acylaminoacyl peptidase